MKIRFKFLPAAVLALACVDSSNRTSTSDTTSASRQAPVVTSVTVNHGTYGMSSKLKWLISSDGSAIIAVVDPVGVENEPIPNAFFYGSESRNFQTRMDSVWDVAPSPDWGSIAFSRARTMMNGEADSIPSSMWQDLARRTGMDTTTLRTGS